MGEDRIAGAREFVDWWIAGRAAADPVVDELLALPPSAWDRWLESHPGACTVHVLELLVQIAARDASRALPLTDFVLRHAREVGTPEGAGLTGTYLLGNAWRVRAVALREAGEPHAAQRAFEMAAAVFHSEPAMFEEWEEAEREAASLHQEPSLTARLLAETPYAKWPRLAEREELRHPGALAELSREAVARVERAPRESLAVMELATAIADSLSSDDFPKPVLAQLRAKAWTDRGTALRYLARYVESLAASDTAEQILEPFAKLAHDRAIGWLARASTLVDANRTEDVTALLGKAREVFGQYRDARRELLCAICNGTLLYRLGRYAESVAACLELLPAAYALNDGYIIAVLHNDIAHAAIGAGDEAEAETHLEQAVTIANELGRPLLAARSELVRGRMLLRRGDVEGALAHLHRVREQFQQQYLAEEAGLCGLDLVEAHLTRGASIEAEALAREILREFTAAHLNQRAITALRYLQGAIASRKASIATVENVKRFIESLRNTPDAEFKATA